MALFEIRPVSAGDWPRLREIRLAALRDAPLAFASTYSREVTFSEADWKRRAASSGTFLAHPAGPGQDGQRPLGLVGGYVAGPGTAELVSLWVRPDARGQRIGEALVEAVVGWARAQDLARVHLWVSESNDAARRLYARCGFTGTGERQPLPSHPQTTEMAMARPAVARRPA